VSCEESPFDRLRALSVSKRLHLQLIAKRSMYHDLKICCHGYLRGNKIRSLYVIPSVRITEPRFAIGTIVATVPDTGWLGKWGREGLSEVELGWLTKAEPQISIMDTIWHKSLYSQSGTAPTIPMHLPMNMYANSIATKPHHMWYNGHTM
jgi:hypothetical protein